VQKSLETEFEQAERFKVRKLKIIRNR